MKGNVLAIALGALLVGGVAVGAYHNNRDADAASTTELADGESARMDYAQIVAVTPVIESGERYATVIGSEPVRETTTSTSPRRVCRDIVAQDRLPERDGNVGNRVGGGDGRRLATIADVVGGGFTGRETDRRHDGGRVIERVDRQCTTVQDNSQGSRVVAWNVTYRNPDGTTGTMRTGSRPGERIALGTGERTIGYDVTYRYEGIERTVRMRDDPGERLPVRDGEVMTRMAAMEVPGRG